MPVVVKCPFCGGTIGCYGEGKSGTLTTCSKCKTNLRVVVQNGKVYVTKR